MKCIRDKSTDTIRRVSDEKAAELVAKGPWKYTSKGAWKSAGRPGK